MSRHSNIKIADYAMKINTNLFLVKKFCGPNTEFHASLDLDGFKVDD